MSSSNFASFAPYAPPPDEPVNTSTKSSANSRISSRYDTNVSYQSGGIPSFGTSLSGGTETVEHVETLQSPWTTRYGMRVDILAALAYLFGPISALLLLILETENDYVRFHSYQSALLTAPVMILRILSSITHAPSWIQSLLTFCLICSQISMACKAFYDGSQSQLSMFHLPFIGPIAAEWLLEE
ncbi:hypothetical protein BDQ17DRAFT_1294753 [Cyathus striatus]|nr:hypothetical protein BDQ17DRAFT_1294753 [Cyathus striatus]